MAETRSEDSHPESMPEMEWDELAPGGEISATVMMASGFVLQEGQRVRERYHIERVLGEGAMGQVLAVTLVGSSDKQTYALKVVARPVSDEGSEASEEHAEAERHAKWFAQLLRAEAAKQDVVQRHGVSVARLFALVQLDDGSIGMRMELARGRSLEAQVEEERANREEPPEVMWSVTVVRKLVSQLRRLHEMVESGTPFGFVHSDIKPGNVFVDDNDPTDVLVTLLDFGVATAGQALVADLTLRHSSRKTFVLQQTGGTIGYAPPFHFSGKATPLSDVYASIVILYELLTTEFPWRFGEIPITPDNIVQLEAAMLQGPRPVREVRPSVPLEDARIVDEFFAREFKVLHELAETVSRELGDEKKEPPRSLIETLQKLAREFQTKLDALRNRLSPSRRPPAAELPSGAMPVIPKAPGTPKFPGFEIPSADTGRHSGDHSPTLLTRRKPKLIVMASVPPPSMASASERKRGNRPEAAVQSAVRERAPAPRERVRTPTQPRPAPRKLPWLWIGAAIAVPVVATLVVLIARMVSSHGPAHAPPPSAAPPAVAALASTPPVVVAAPVPPPAPTPAPAVVVPPPAVVAPVVAAATPPSTESRVGLADLANAPLVRPPDAPHHYHAHHAASAAGGTGSQPCMCVATVQNATVVAQGGTLAHEVALCTATDAAGQGRGEFLGTGAIPTTVLGAQAELSCRQGDRSLQLVVQRYALAGGTGSLFRCRARTAPADGEAAAPPNAGAAHRPSSGGDANP